jgi:hypothetical protein
MLRQSSVGQKQKESRMQFPILEDWNPAVEIDEELKRDTERALSSGRESILSNQAMTPTVEKPRRLGSGVNTAETETETSKKRRESSDSNIKEFKHAGRRSSSISAGPLVKNLPGN